ncbi:MAG: anhydro-N-acetylmuramic acid kinase, partial [Flavobacteriales bacterium]
AGRVVGYDVCIGNQALNYLAEEAGLDFDADGALARAGKCVPELRQRMNALPFHHQPPPRSLGREWFDAEFRPLIEQDHSTLADRMATVVEHIAHQVGHVSKDAKGPLLVTGGGAHNSFLMERIRSLAACAVEVPDPVTVDFKEALVFALLGVRRLRGEVNTLASVTGASDSSVGGAVYAVN